MNWHSIVIVGIIMAAVASIALAFHSEDDWGDGLVAGGFMAAIIGGSFLAAYLASISTVPIMGFLSKVLGM